MRDRLLLGLYLAAIIAATLVHRPTLLAGGLLLVALLSGREAARIGRGALPFAGVLSLSMLAAGHLAGGSVPAYLLRMNLRLLLLTWMSLLLTRRVNLFRALAFSPRLSALLVLASGQIRVTRRLLAEFRLALASRSPERPGLRLLYQHAGATGRHFLRRSLRDGEELAQALRSRGFDLD